MSNPVIIPINPNGSPFSPTDGAVKCFTNASFIQKAVVKIFDKNQNVVAEGTFEGSGENNAPAKLLPPNEGFILNFLGDEKPLTLEANLFYNSGGGFVPYPADKVSVQETYSELQTEVIVIKAEDSVDHDHNDLILQCVAHS